MEPTCKLTGLRAENFDKGDKLYYSVDLGESTGHVEFNLCKSCKFPVDLEDKFLTMEIQRAVVGLIINGKLNPEAYTTIHWNPRHSIDTHELDLADFLSQAVYPKTTRDRRHRFLQWLGSQQEYECQARHIFFSEIDVWGRNYYIEPMECKKTIEYFHDKRFLNVVSSNQVTAKLSLTHYGLNELDRLKSEENQSNYGFIAMSFDESMLPIQGAIKRAIEKSGFDPLIVNEARAKSDQTIPDKIFASIRQARFCVSDFTQHRHGVYFEAGYAVGLGIPVFYACQKEDFENAHFDVKQLQHIIYDTPEELENQLEAKIKAWID